MSKLEDENPVAAAVGTLIGAVIALFIASWTLEWSLITLFGPIMPDTWKSVGAVAGVLVGLRFVLTAARAKRNK